MKILVIRFSSIGDIVLTTPVLRCIKAKYPEATLHYLSKNAFGQILKANPYIDKQYLFDGDLRDLVFELLAEKYDYIIDLQHNYRSHYIKSMLRQAYNSNIKIYSVNKLNMRKLLLTKCHINSMPDKSIVDRYMDTVKKMGVLNDGLGLEFHMDEEEKIKSDDLPMSHSAGYISFVIGGAHATKRFPVEKWKALCALVDFPIILQGGKEDEEAGKEIAQIDPIRIYNSCGKFSIHESADIIRYAKVVVTNDTGLMHIAAAFKRNIITLWGNTTPSLGMFPYYGFNNLKSRVAPNLIHIQNNNLRCRPCSKIGYKKCPKKHFKCMNLLEVTTIKVGIDKLMGLKP